MTVATLAEH